MGLGYDLRGGVQSQSDLPDFKSNKVDFLTKLTKSCLCVLCFDVKNADILATSTHQCFPSDKGGGLIEEDFGIAFFSDSENEN